MDAVEANARTEGRLAELAETVGKLSQSLADTIALIREQAARPPVIHAAPRSDDGITSKLLLLLLERSDPSRQMTQALEFAKLLRPESSPWEHAVSALKEVAPHLSAVVEQGQTLKLISALGALPEAQRKSMLALVDTLRGGLAAAADGDGGES